MGLNTDIRVLWPSTAASIPSSWTRDTAFDDRFLQGSSSAGTNGGVSNHTHVVDTHNHTGDAHNHGTPSAGSSTGSVACTGFGVLFASDGHTHASTTTADQTITYVTTVATINSTNAQPAFMRVIVIGPDDSSQEMPDDSVGFFSSSSVPSGFQLADGSGGTVNLTDRFVLGAAAGGDGGGTGGSATHVHTSPAHSHSFSSHNHPQSDYSVASSSTAKTSIRGSQGMKTTHHKQNTLSAASGSTSSDALSVDSASSEPAHTLLHAIQNISGGASTPDGVILPFVGATVPEGWQLCDGSDGTPDLTTTQVKVTMSPTSLGQTAGSDSDHTHTSPAHGHTGVSHLHAFSLSDFNIIDVDTSSSGTSVAASPHSHFMSGSNTDPTTPTLQNQTAVLNSSSWKPLFRTVKFIRKRRTTVKLRGGTVRGAAIR